MADKTHTYRTPRAPHKSKGAGKAIPKRAVTVAGSTRSKWLTVGYLDLEVR